MSHNHRLSLLQTKLIYPNYTEEINYSKVSNITSITADDKTKTFDYDAIDRLISYDLNITEYQRFSYDDNGNRLSLVEDENTTYTYKDKTNILEKSENPDINTTYTYDETGNIIGDGTHTYTYDGRNRLVGVDSNVRYTYNYDNKRTSKTVDGTTTYFIYDAHKLVGEYDADGTVIKEYLYNGNTPIAVVTADGISRIYADHLDTSRRVANDAGEIVWQWESKPFGEDEANGTITMNLRFPGQYYDAETKTHYNINRDYNPVIGRYIQSDPIGLCGGVNSYLYVNGEPLTNIDMEGLVDSTTIVSGVVNGLHSRIKRLKVESAVAKLSVGTKLTSIMNETNNNFNRWLEQHSSLDRNYHKVAEMQMKYNQCMHQIIVKEAMTGQIDNTCLGNL